LGHISYFTDSNVETTTKHLLGAILHTHTTYTHTRYDTHNTTETDINDFFFLGGKANKSFSFKRLRRDEKHKEEEAHENVNAKQLTVLFVSS